MGPTTLTSAKDPPRCMCGKVKIDPKSRPRLLYVGVNWMAASTRSTRRAGVPKASLRFNTKVQLGH